MAIEKISENKRKQIINKSVNPLPNNPSKAGYKADEIKKAMFNFVTDEKDSVVDEINRIVDETNASFDDINNTNQETSKTIESINNTIKQINDTVSDKVDKEEGKHLSSNDFSSEEKEKLAKLTNYDDSEVRAGINEINSKIPAQASSTNQLADKDFVNSSIETATATFKGTFEDLDLLKTTPADKNDYAFYDHISNSNRVFDRYKFNGTEWVYEYTLNNSSFTDAQWKAINSGATAELINKILTNADNINTILNTLNNIDTRLNDTVDKSSPQNISGLKNFTKRPTVNNTEVALKTDIAEGVGTTVTVKGEAVTEFNADTKVNVETGKSLSSNDFTDALLNKLNGIAEGANKTTIDTALSDTSTNPVQNKIINNALKSKLSTTGNAVSATKATQDGDGNVISSTYVKTSTKYNRTSVNALTALATWAGNTNIPTLNTIAYWDGRYQTTNNASNIAYCKHGALGTMATKTATTRNFTLNGGTALPTYATGTTAASWYAPTTVGSANQILKSNGSGAPTWINQSAITAGSATKATKLANTTAIGGENTPVYFTSGGVPKSVGWFRGDWVAVDPMTYNYNTQSTSKVTIDLYDSAKRVIPDYTETSMYEVIVGINLYRSSGTTACRFATDVIGDISNADKCFNPIASGESEYGRALMTVPVKRYLYYFLTSTSSTSFDIKIFGYRRVK